MGGWLTHNSAFQKPYVFFHDKANSHSAPSVIVVFLMMLVMPTEIREICYWAFGLLFIDFCGKSCLQIGNKALKSWRGLFIRQSGRNSVSNCVGNPITHDYIVSLLVRKTALDNWETTGQVVQTLQYLLAGVSASNFGQGHLILKVKPLFILLLDNARVFGKKSI